MTDKLTEDSNPPPVQKRGGVHTETTDQDLASILAQAGNEGAESKATKDTFSPKTVQLQLSPADRGTLTHILNGVGECLGKVDRLIADNAKNRPKTLADIGATSRDGTAYAKEVRHRQRHDMTFVFLLGAAFGAGLVGVAFGVMGG